MGFFKSQFFTEILPEFGVKLLGAVAVFVFGLWLVKKILFLLDKATEKSKLDEGLRTFFRSFLKVILYLLLFMTVAKILGIPTTTFITMIASAGVAIGLALQGALSNFAGGIMILAFKPFKVGDYIKAGEHEGFVRAITVLYTKIVTYDNLTVTLPNGELSNAPVVDYSALGIRRINFNFSVSYSSDIDKVNEILMSVAKNHELVLSEPAPDSRLMKHSESSLDFSLRVWCKFDDYWKVLFDINEEVKKEFDKNGIEIPFPQVDVHMK